MKFTPVCLYILLVLPAVAGAACEPGADDPFPCAVDSRDVNEGSLEMLPSPPSGPVHRHSNRITLTAASLVDGWARLYQCHTHLDKVTAAQIVYHADRVRKLKVDSFEGIGRAWVEGATVQLENISATAELCIDAESRVVQPLADNRFVVRNGPYMRRFLDGYYPMHVTLEIILPPGDWTLEKSGPAAQAGFSVARKPGGIFVDAWFEGKLETEFYFMPAVNRQAPHIK